MNNLTNQEIEFLKESNEIEGEYSEQAMDDAVRSWSFAKTCLKNGSEIDIQLIKLIHQRLMENINPEIAGKFRKVQVGVMTKNGFKEAIHHSKIKEELRLLCCHSLNPYYIGEEQIKQGHINFEHIHPFEDGNGRTGRILMNIQRLKIGLPLLIIHTGKEQQDYYKWFTRLTREISKDFISFQN